jgi:hypothetical protein
MQEGRKRTSIGAFSSRGIRIDVPARIIVAARAFKQANRHLSTIEAS